MPNYSPTLRVLNVLFESRYGGPQKRVSQVGEVLFTYGVQTILCQPPSGKVALKAAQEARVPIRDIAFERIPRPQDLKRVLRWAVLLPRDVWRFVDLFRRERPDIVHVNGAFFIAPAIAAKLAGIPLVWHLNDTIVPPRIAAVFGVLVRTLANQIVVAAEAVALHYGVNRGAYKVIYAPVDTKKFRAPEPTSKGFGQEVPRIGLIANWSPLKGVEYFVQAAGLVREQLGGKLEVVFVGERFSTHLEYCQRVDELIDELNLGSAIHDYGFVASASDMATILAGMDVLVLSSTTEASPMVVLEGMAAGVPVVATDVGGVREMLLGDPSSPAGTVVPPRDPEALAKAILDLLDHSEKATLMGKNGHRLAKEHFSLEVCARRHLEVYTHIRNRLVRES